MMNPKDIAKYSFGFGGIVLVYQILTQTGIGAADFISLGFLIPTWPMVGYAALGCIAMALLLTVSSFIISKIYNFSSAVLSSEEKSHKITKEKSRQKSIQIEREEKPDLGTTPNKNSKEARIENNKENNNIENKYKERKPQSRNSKTKKNSKEGF